MNTRLSISIIAASASLALAGCATPTSPLGMAKGNPETIIYKASPARISAALAERCDIGQMFVEQRSDTSVVCSRESSLGAQLLMGTPNGSGVQSKIQFNLIPLGKGTKVVGRAWFENMNAFGGVQRDVLTTGPVPAALQANFLDPVKARFDGGKK